MTAKEVASWAKRAREATVQRDQAIHRMRDAGSPLRTIAEAAGLTHTAVAKILKRHACCAHPKQWDDPDRCDCACHYAV